MHRLDVYRAKKTFFSHLPPANNCQPRQNPLELPSAWQVLRGATAPNPTYFPRRRNE